MKYTVLEIVSHQVVNINRINYDRYYVKVELMNGKGYQTKMWIIWPEQKDTLKKWDVIENGKIVKRLEKNEQLELF